MSGPFHRLRQRAPRDFLAALTGPAPCDACDHAQMCGRHELACESFAKFTQLRRWRDAPREPDRVTFLKIYRTYDEAEAELREQSYAAMRKRKLETVAMHGLRPGRKPRVQQTGGAPC